MKNYLEVPKLPYWPFVVSDLVLVFAAYEVGSSSSGPLVGLPLVCVSVCIALGAVLLGLPWVVNYTRVQESFLYERQKEITALAQSTSTSAEQISIAVSGLVTLTESANKAVRHADQLPMKLQERVNEFKAQLNEVAVTENEALSQEINTLRSAETERLESAVSALHKAVREIDSLHASLAAFALKARTEITQSHSDALALALRALDQKILDFKEAAASTPIPAPAPIAPTIPSTLQVVDTPAIVPGPVAPAEAPVAHEPSPTSGSTPPLPELHQRAQEEAPSERLVPAPLAAPARRPSPPKREPNAMDLGLEIEESFSQTDSEFQPPAISADGFTRMIVTAYIGIGNKLYVRGDGPGLSWEKGVPLQFVSIGKWRWETSDAVGPISVKLFKNDQTIASNLPSVTLIPGHQTEVTAQF